MGLNFEPTIRDLQITTSLLIYFLTNNRGLIISSLFIAQWRIQDLILGGGTAY